MTGHLPREPVGLRRIQGLIDALVHDVHVRPVGEVDAQLVADLARAPLVLQQFLDRLT